MPGIHADMNGSAGRVGGTAAKHAPRYVRPEKGATERETPCIAPQVSSTREIPGDRMTAVLRLRSGEGTVAVEWAGAVLAQRMQAGRGMYGPC